MSQTLILSLRIFCALLVTSIFHRVLTFAPLATDSGLVPSTLQVLRFGLVGFLSDIWIAFLACLVPIPLLLFLKRRSLAQSLTAWLWTLLIISLAAFHQSYVDFFHFQIIPVHIPYMWDPDFISANARTVFSLKSNMLFALGLATFAVVTAVAKFKSWGRIKLLVVWSCLALVSLAAHNRNIHFRVQWFVPENLQVNALERLYLNFKTAKAPRLLKEQDLKQLEAYLGNKEDFNNLALSIRLFRDVTRPIPTDQEMSAIGIEIKNIWSKKMLEKKRPLLQVILLESFRPADTASFDSNTVSLTPSFDHIVKNSISFKRAYSYGTVTRGAQEAVFCGYLGSQDTSLMRGRSEIKVTCLPELIKNSSSPGELFWFHGGEGRFDGQLNFWQKHGIKNVMTIDDFTASAPRTGWGIGDGSFFIRAAQELQNLHKISTHPYLVGMLLSVSNHIPWDLPQDAPPNIQNLAVSHPSYRTTAYTDWALGEYISSLKQSGLWSDSIIIIASDHGTTTTPYAGGAFNTTEAELKNHINLALTGGIIEGALSNLQKQSLQIDEWTAQTDISAFIAYLLNTNDIRVMGESLLISDRHLPLIVDLGKNYYLPVLGKTLSQTEALHAPLETFTDPAERVSVIYNRAFLQLLNEWSKKPKRFD